MTDPRAGGDADIRAAELQALEAPDFGVEVLGEAESVAKGSALLLSARIVGNTGFFVAVLILARALSVPHRGEFAFATTAAQVLTRVAGLGVMEATTVFAAQRMAPRGRLLTNVFLFTGFSTAAVSVVFFGTLALLDEVQHLGLSSVDLALVVDGAIASAVSAAGMAFLTGCGLWRTQSIISAASPWLYALLLGLTWGWRVLNVESALAVWVTMYVVWSVAVIIASVRQTPLGRPSAELLRSALKFGVRAWVGSVTGLLNYRMDQVLMGFIATAAALGVYAVSVNTSEILLILPSAAATALLPFLTRSDVRSHADRTLRAFRILGVSSLGMMLAAGVFGPILVPLIFGSDYQSAVVPFLWLIAGTLGYVASSVFASALLSISSPGLASVAPIASLAIGTALDFALIPSLGATGAAIAATVAFYVAGCVSFFAYRWRVRFSYDLLVPRRSDLDLTRVVIMRVMRSSSLLRPLSNRLSST